MDTFIIQRKLIKLITHCCTEQAMPEKHEVSIASVTGDTMADGAENEGETGDRSVQGLEVACNRPGGTIIIRGDNKSFDEMKDITKWINEATGVKGFIQEWHGSKFYTINSFKDLEVALNSGIQYEKTHELRARCTVFFTRVDKDILFRIKNKAENERLRKKAEEDSGITIEDIRHIGIGRTLRVHCRTPTGAETIIKNGLTIGGIKLRKGKIEELKPIIQCTHCWKVDHTNRHCSTPLSKQPPICGTCGKTGHRRKDCPTPNDPKCVLCDGKHSSSAARCLVRQAKVEETIRFQKEYVTNISTPSQQSVSVQVGSAFDIMGSAFDITLQQCAGMIQTFVSQINETDSAVKAIQANVKATILLSAPTETATDVSDAVHAAIAVTIRPKYDSYDIVKRIGDTAWRQAKGSRGTFLELYKEYLIQNDLPVPDFPDSLLED